MMQHLKNNFLKYTLTPLFVLMIAASYYRFIVLHDHLVSYKINCNPVAESCYIECEGEEIDDISNCPNEKIFYFATIERYAANLLQLCGETVTDCEAADYCVESEKNCSITYCDSTTETCDDNLMIEL